MEEQTPGTDADDPTRVSMSEKTRAEIGPLADRIAAWTDSDHVIVLSARDLEGVPHRSRSNVLRETFERVSGESIFNNSSMLVSETGAREEYLQHLVKRITAREHFAVDHTPLGGIDTIGTATDFTKTELLRQMTGIPSRNFRDIPGSDRDWQAAVLMHEAEHLDDELSFVRERQYENEVNSDAFLLEQYSEELALGTVEEPSVPENFLHARAIASFNGFGAPTHLTNIAVDTPQGISNAPTDFISNVTALMDAQLLVAQEMGVEIDVHSLKADALKEIFTEDSIDPRSVFGLDSEQLRIAREGVERADPAVIAELESRLRSNSRDIFNVYMDAVFGRVGENIYEAQKDNPEYFYETTRSLYLRGRFDENPLGKEFAYEYLQGARAIAPDYYAVDRDEIIPGPRGEENSINPAIPAPLNTLQNGLNR